MRKKDHFWLQVTVSRRVTFFDKLVDSSANYKYTRGYEAYFRVIYDK